MAAGSVKIELSSKNKATRGGGGQAQSPARRPSRAAAAEKPKPAGPTKKKSTDDLIQEQLRDTLKKKIIKLADLFQQWDADGDGEVSLKEWRLAMPAIGIQTDKKHIDKLFEQFDLDGGGTRSISNPGASPSPSPNPTRTPTLTLTLTLTLTRHDQSRGAQGAALEQLKP
mgnify:CR=1 FL=1